MKIHPRFRAYLQTLLGKAQVVAVVDNQFGDGGKGKIVDLLMWLWAEIDARGGGGANAGHTIWIRGKRHVFHLLPSGILHDAAGKMSIMGNGMVIDPMMACQELVALQKAGLSCDCLRIAYNAKLVLPAHVVLDRVREKQKGAIGTTGRGITQTYVDHYARCGLTINDLLNPHLLKAKLEQNLASKIRVLQDADKGLVRDVMMDKALGYADFYHRKTIFDEKAILRAYVRLGEKLSPFITDTDALMRDSLKQGRNILLEGAQGALLSIDYGTYPFVTSSDSSIHGLAKGVGLCQSDVDMTLGVTKAPYMTRVGGGPFPTEFGGHQSEAWCAKPDMNKGKEKLIYARPDINSLNQFLQGVAIRQAGDEYGSTTGRPRRTGWLDLPLLRHAIQINDRKLVLTKLDVLDKCQQIKICVGYQYFGSVYCQADRIITDGDTLDVAIPEAAFLANCQPVYKVFPGWCTPTGHIRSYGKLPTRLKTLISFVEKETSGKVVMVSVGQDREQTIIKV